MTDYRNGRDGYSQYLRQIERENGGNPTPVAPPRDTGCTWPTGLHHFRTRVCTRCGVREDRAPRADQTNVTAEEN